MEMRKLMALLLSVLMLATLSVPALADTVAATDTPADYGGLVPMEDADDPITYTVFVRDPGMAPASDNPVIQKIQELTGVTLKFEYLVGDLGQKLGVMIAGGDYPDAIFAGDSASKLVEAGAFIPLEDEIPKYENLNKLYSNVTEFMKAEDGHIYIMDIYAATKNDVASYAPTFRNGYGFYIQKAVMEDAGYPIPRTIDEYLKLIEDYMAKYPEIDGVKTIGFEMINDGWRNWGVNNPVQSLIGAGNDGALYVDPVTFETSFYQASDTAYEYYKKLNEAYHKGLIDPETFTQSYDQYIARISTGAVLGFFDQTWNFQNAENVLKDEGKYERTYISVPLTNPGVQDGYLDAPSGRPGSVNGIGITVNCQNPERLLRFYDWLLQREVQDYIRWGVEDVDYVATEDGGRKLTDEGRAIMYDVAKKRDLTGHTLANYTPKWIGIYSDGAPTSPDESADEYLASLSEYDIDFLTTYGYKYPAEMMSDPVVRAQYHPIWAMVLEDGSPAAVSNTKITDVISKYYPRLVLASNDADYDAIWEAFAKEFEAIDLDAYQTEIDRQIELKNSL